MEPRSFAFACGGHCSAPRLTVRAWRNGIKTTFAAGSRHLLQEPLNRGASLAGQSAFGKFDVHPRDSMRTKPLRRVPGICGDSQPGIIVAQELLIGSGKLMVVGRVANKAVAIVLQNLFADAV